MTTKEELSLELTNHDRLIHAHVEKMKFLHMWRGQGVMKIMYAMNASHPELFQRFKEVQQAYGLSLPDALDFLQQGLLPYQLHGLFEHKRQLENQLKLLHEQEQAPVPMHEAGHDDGGSVDSSEAQETIAMITGSPAHQLDYSE